MAIISVELCSQPQIQNLICLFLTYCINQVCVYSLGRKQLIDYPKLFYDILDLIIFMSLELDYDICYSCCWLAIWLKSQLKRRQCQIQSNCLQFMVQNIQKHRFMFLCQPSQQKNYRTMNSINSIIIFYTSSAMSFFAQFNPSTYIFQLLYMFLPASFMPVHTSNSESLYHKYKQLQIEFQLLPLVRSTSSSFARSMHMLMFYQSVKLFFTILYQLARTERVRIQFQLPIIGQLDYYNQQLIIFGILLSSFCIGGNIPTDLLISIR